MCDNRSAVCPLCGGWMEMDEMTASGHCDTCDYEIQDGLPVIPEDACS